jgi:hypothetical protein
MNAHSFLQRLFFDIQQITVAFFFAFFLLIMSNGHIVINNVTVVSYIIIILLLRQVALKLSFSFDHSIGLFMTLLLLSVLNCEV